MRVRLVHLLVIVLLAGAAAAAAERIDRVLAVVSGRVITESDVRAALAFDLVQRRADADPVRTTLDQLIRRDLVLTELTNAAVAEPDAAVVEKRLDAIRAGFPSVAAYQARLADTAMDEARLRDMIEAAIRVDDYVRQRFAAVPEPSSDEIAIYYNAHRTELTRGGRQLSFEETKPAVRERLIEERRNQAVEDWLVRLRRRTEVTDLYFADSR